MKAIIFAVFLNCGIPPVTPPIGMYCSGEWHTVCVCDSDGNCEWKYVCEQ